MDVSRCGLMLWVGSCDRCAKNARRRTKSGVVLALAEHCCDQIDPVDEQRPCGSGRRPVRVVRSGAPLVVVGSAAPKEDGSRPREIAQVGRARPRHLRTGG